LYQIWDAKRSIQVTRQHQISVCIYLAQILQTAMIQKRMLVTLLVRSLVLFYFVYALILLVKPLWIKLHFHSIKDLLCRLADLVGLGVALATGMQYIESFPERVYKSMLIPLMFEDKRAGKISHVQNTVLP
jgi:hypothetical protein